jgi:hypothetical protein
MAELTPQQLAGAIPSRVRKRLMLGRFESAQTCPRFDDSSD